MSGKSPFHNLISVAVSFALTMALAVTTAAQNGVPPTARQAAMMPAFNSRLAHPTMSHMPARPPALSRSRFSPRRPLDNNILYDNGPVNGEVDAWTINFSSTVSDTIQVNGSVTGIQFWAWLEPGDAITNIEVQLGSTGYFSNNLFDSVVTLTQSSCFTNNFGFDVCLVSGNFTGPTLSGNDWITLANANTAEGQPVYWDENSGVGCQSPGCPSMAQEDTLGTIPSEAFTIAGAATTTSMDCSQNPYGFSKAYEFTGGSDGGLPTGVVADRAGNLEGTNFLGGDNGNGTAFKLTQEGSGWVLTDLYSFPGGSNGSTPWGPILGPDQTLYGLAWGAQGYGLIYNLTPPPTACRTALCPWTENVLSPFPHNLGSNVALSGFDRAGNLYGLQSGGGAYGAGYIFQLTPTLGGWTENTIYTFTGGNDGSQPTGLVIGIDGNLYGTTGGGGAFADGTIFQLVPSGNGWTENVLFAFQGNYTGYGPTAMVQDSLGNLYIAYQANVYNPLGPEIDAFIMKAWQSNGNWIFTNAQQYSPENWESYAQVIELATDDAGNLAVEVYAACPPCVFNQFIYNRLYWNWRFDLGESETLGGPMAIRQQGSRLGHLFAAGWCNTIWEVE